MAVNILKLRQQYEISKAMTVARIAIRTALIPVTVDIFETRRRYIGPKVTNNSYEEGRFRASKGMTVNRMRPRGGGIPWGGGSAEHGRI